MKVCLGCEKRFEAEDWQCPECGYCPEQIHDFLAFAPVLAEQNDGFDAKYFGDLAQLEAGNFWFKCRNRLITWAIHRYFLGAHNLLEIGCGTGYVLSGIQGEFPHLVLAGSEVFTKGLALSLKRLPKVKLFQMDARRIPFENEFDIIGAFDVLEHIEADGNVLYQMFRAAKPGGGIIITVPQHHFLWSAADNYAHHKRRYSRREIIEKVNGAKFEIRRITSFVFFLLPLMFISRMMQRNFQNDYDPQIEFRVPSVMNKSFMKILDFERILIQSGISFPAGGSLLVVATKK